MDFADIKQLEDSWQVATYAKMDIAVERGSGSYIWTSDGTRYLDLYGGHAVCATGHCHPTVVDAIRQQSEKVLFYSNLVYSELRAEAARKLAAIAPEGLSKVFFCNSGTEANENAMRIARLATGREKVVSFTKGFHGRTADSISATFLGTYRDLGRPNVPSHAAAVFGDIEDAVRVADGETAAILIEPIQSMAGVYEAEPQFFQALRDHCDKLGIVLIFDEVQTGVGRTGEWFFSGSAAADGVVPDVISLAKSLGSGVPVGACLIRKALAEKIKTNDLGTTFGGGMLAMAAVVATLDAIESEGMLDNARRVESYLRKQLAANTHVRSVRGKGCLLGIEFIEPCGLIHQRLLESNIITGTSSDPHVLRLLPPLCLTIDELSLFVEVLNS